VDYLCAKFSDFTLSRFVFIVRTDRQNHIGGSTLYSRDYRRRESCNTVFIWLQILQLLAPLKSQAYGTLQIWSLLLTLVSLQFFHL